MNNYISVKQEYKYYLDYISFVPMNIH